MSIIDDLKNIDFRAMDLKSIDPKNMDLKNSHTQALLFTVFVSFAAIALYLYFVFVPQAIGVFGVISKAGKVKSELKSAKAVIRDFERLKNDLKERGQKVESYEGKLPVEQEIPALLENLSRMAKDSDIKIVGIVPAMSHSRNGRTSGESPIYREIPILITAKSGYHELGRFLGSLENSDRFMKVVDIDIKSNASNPKRHDVELMVCTYILLQEK